MGTLFRSEQMVQAELFLPNEAAYECVNALGEQELVEILDQNDEENVFEFRFVNEVRRCDEIRRLIRFLEKECIRQKITFSTSTTSSSSLAPDASAQEEIENTISSAAEQVKVISDNYNVLKKQEQDLIEIGEVLQKASKLVDGKSLEGPSPDHTAELREQLLFEERKIGRGKSFELGFITGTILRTKGNAFERILWRVSHGFAFVRRFPMDAIITNVDSGEELKKDVFIVIFQGQVLEEKVKKICDGMQADTYPCPEDSNQRQDMAHQVRSRLDDVSRVLHSTQEHLQKVLGKVALDLRRWDAEIVKAQSVYVTLNKFNFDTERKSLLASCWCPEKQVGAIQDALATGAARSRTGAHPIFTPHDTTETAPTYFLTNKYTHGFQAIVNAYGVASYQEVNPGPFTIITFPFLFAVMFGDYGHGILMSLFAYWMVSNERKLGSYNGGEIWDTVFGGRYIILLMGIFSIYTGLIYNDIFSKSFGLFGSTRWVLPDEFHEDKITLSTSKDCSEAATRGCFKGAYPIGVDPMWSLAENALTFTNSYKMKLSVILGVMQMSFGVCLSYYNGKYFGRSLDVYHVFIPQILFLWSIFGYLCIAIIYKWCSSSFPDHNPPSLLLMLINMFLNFGGAKKEGEVLYGDQQGNFQIGVEMFLVLVALVCVPWMLLVKPLILRKRMQSGSVPLGSHSPDEEEEDHGFGEIMVHQAIHTIEYCLGAISNTASYLRLWALSLAHAQLSEVLWEMVLTPIFSSAPSALNPILLYVAFSVWAALSVAILLVMEGLSAFLHALRLHWVEFQNKFYEGEGRLFEPFSFKVALSEAEEHRQN
eukprot:m.340539 g.340539  ORF g.340539 m.340539 type:complete len:822 (+) comp19350_c0_seq1:98-2563(+)